MNPLSQLQNFQLALILLLASSVFRQVSGFKHSFKLLKDAVGTSRVGTVRKMLQRGVKPDEEYFNEETRQTLLMRAAWRGDRDIVLLLLHYGADVNRMNYNGATAVFYAAAGGNPDVMRILAKSGAPLNVKDKLGQSPLHWAVAANQVRTLRYGIDNGLDPHLRDVRRRTPLDMARQFSSARCVEHLKSCCGVPPTTHPATSGGNGRFPRRHHDFESLRVACGENDRKEIRRLLRSGAHPDAGYWDPQYNITLLMHAAETANVGVVKLLLKHGADPNKKNPFGLSAMHYAAAGGTKAVLRDLIDAGGDLLAVTKDGWSVAHCAAAYNRVENLEYAVSMGVDFAAKDRLGKTALDHARMMDNQRVVKVLKKLQDERDRSSPPPPPADEQIQESKRRELEERRPPNFDDLRTAVDSMDAEKVEELLKLGLKPDDGFHDGFDRVTLLMEAAARRYRSIVRLLLVYGADPNKMTKMNRRTAMHYAAAAGDVEIMDRLVKAGGDIQKVDIHKMSVLHWAVVGDHVAALKYGINKGVDLFIRDADGYTALQMAKRIRSGKCMRHLKWVVDNSARVRFMFVPRSGAVA